jgi:hypothetical protein
MWDISISFPVLAFASLYNRQILATGVLGISIEAEKGDEILKNKGCKMASERLTKFDSPVAVYDLSRRQEGKATYYSEGELNIKYLSPLDDSAFDNLINAVKAEQAAVPVDANSV